MGAGTITDEIGDGLYTVLIDDGQAELNTRISNLTTRIDEITLDLVSADAELQTAKANAAVVYGQLNDAIDVYAAALGPDNAADAERAIVQDLTVSGFEQSAIVQKAQYKVDNLEIEKKACEEEKSYLSEFNLQSSQDLWCADYTLEAAGSVGIIEIPGESVGTGNESPRIIVPGAETPIETDGKMTGRPAQNADQIYYNLALLPGWEKYRPTYRLATITDIDRQNDTCNLTLDNQLSTEQNLDINQEIFLEDVAIEYLTCNSAAFKIWDRIVIKFEGQDWENPKVIGFEQEPKACAVGHARSQTLDSSASPFLGWWRFNVRDKPGTDLLTILRDTESVSQPMGITLEIREDTETEWTELVFNHISTALHLGSYKPYRWFFNIDGFSFGGGAEPRPPGAPDYLWVTIWDGTQEYTSTTSSQLAWPGWWDPTYPIILEFAVEKSTDAIGGKYYPSFDPAETIELRIIDNATDLPIVHFTMRASDFGVYNVEDIDQVPPGNVPVGTFGTDNTLIKIPLDDYEFPPE